MSSDDWVAWHAPYDDPNSPLARRLQCVQEVVSEWLDRRSAGQRHIVSACAGQGRDLLEVLADRDDVDGVSARLVELDPTNVAAARRLAVAVPEGVEIEIVEADAGQLTAYDGAVPADLVLMCGVFGNISDDDVRRTVASLPMLCATRATVVWTRHRREPDLTPSIRSWFAEAGFMEESFVAPDLDSWSVGVHVFDGEPESLDPHLVMFRFV
ncbi:MAG TPA: SAM-dependent methyltransferase [Mycobacteriales bacterium]|nr:SAM-dependent methyltransferase [Mycobacteriales bacterium]